MIEQASSVATPAGGRPAETKEARSVVALSRVPRGARGAPVSPPAAGQVVSELRRSQDAVYAVDLGDLAPGGCPASCPDAHRPTHGHRHVRNWAIAHISDMDAHYKNFFRKPPRAHLMESPRWPLASLASAAAGERTLSRRW